MIPEPPDGTVIVLVTAPDDMKLAIREDKAAFMGRPWFWMLEDAYNGPYKWADLLAHGTPHLIGPELGHDQDQMLNHYEVYSVQGETTAECLTCDQHLDAEHVTLSTLVARARRHNHGQRDREAASDLPPSTPPAGCDAWRSENGVILYWDSETCTWERPLPDTAVLLGGQRLNKKES